MDETKAGRTGQNQALHAPGLQPNETGAGDVGNSTSSAPAPRENCVQGLLVRRLLAVGVALGIAGEDLLGDQAGVLADRDLDLGGDVRVGLEERLRILAALAEALAVIGE